MCTINTSSLLVPLRMSCTVTKPQACSNWRQPTTYNWTTYQVVRILRLSNKLRVSDINNVSPKLNLFGNSKKKTSSGPARNSFTFLFCNNSFACVTTYEYKCSVVGGKKNGHTLLLFEKYASRGTTRFLLDECDFFQNDIILQRVQFWSFWTNIDYPRNS